MVEGYFSWGFCGRTKVTPSAAGAPALYYLYENNRIPMGFKCGK
jgi:hypothetical protein